VLQKQVIDCQRRRSDFFALLVLQQLQQQRSICRR
jgi:hypothetical protein